MPILQQDDRVSEGSERVLREIQVKGIIPAQQIKPSQASRLQSVDGETLKYACFNYLKIASKLGHELKSALLLLRDHSDVGLIDIALERQQHTQCKTSRAFRAEVISRLSSTALFICNIPQETQEYIRPICGEKKDSWTSEFFQEIRTRKGVLSEDILAVCVPEHLFDMAFQVFGEKVIKTPWIEGSLSFGSSTLAVAIMSDNPADNLKIDVQMPDYLQSITDFIIKSGKKELGFHLTKLPYVSEHLSDLHFANAKDVGAGLERLHAFMKIAPESNQFIPAVGQPHLNWDEILKLSNVRSLSRSIPLSESEYKSIEPACRGLAKTFERMNTKSLCFFHGPIPSSQHKGFKEEVKRYRGTKYLESFPELGPQ